MPLKLFNIIEAMKSKSYSELILLPTRIERIEYLMLYGKIGDKTFGKNRYLNQMLYRDSFWRDEVRPEIILRDNGCDLGLKGYEIPDGLDVFVHHINPITVEDILNRDPKVFDPENLITTVKKTHDIIHYAFTTEGLDDTPIVRRPNDTKLW